MSYDSWKSTEPDLGFEPLVDDDFPDEPSEAVYEAFNRLQKETEMLMFMAKCAVFPEPEERHECSARGVAYNLQSALDYAHSLVDAVHELRHAMGLKAP